MKIFILSSVYATSSSSGSTPVVHYFAKEWVKQGHEVTACHIESCYPTIFYKVASMYKMKLNSLFGINVPTQKPINLTYSSEGVNIHRITYRKIKPHSRISRKQQKLLIESISQICDTQGVPDVFIGHWENPQLDLLPILKEKFKKPVCLVFHSNGFILEKSFGPDFEDKLRKIDIIGFRNPRAREAFEKKYWRPTKSFIAYSGVSEDFLQKALNYNRDIEMPLNKYIYVGALMDRKHPLELYKALVSAYKSEPFSLTYIGDGDCKQKILTFYNETKCGNVNFTGRIPRNEIISYLKESSIFAMISEGEIFGLVYLEAMSFGLITIGSRGEGIDGIIKDGYNGFLCTPGCEEELLCIIDKIRNMSVEEIKIISDNAKKTAYEYSDSGVAKKYIQYIIDQI